MPRPFPDTEDPEDLGDLAAALAAGDGTTARRLAGEAGTPSRDEVLQHLATQAAGGSALAVELLVEQLDESGVVRRFVRRGLLDESAVDDVTQDCLISIAGSIGSFRGDAKVTTWVHGIVRRRVVDHLRRQRATAPLPDDESAAGSLAHRMSSMIATRATVQDALAALPDLYREPVTLRDLEGLTYAQVAERLDRNVGTVKAQVSRGRALVAAALGGDEWVGS